MTRVKTAEEIKIGDTLIYMDDADIIEGVVKFNAEYRHDATVQDFYVGRCGIGALSPTIVVTPSGKGFLPHLALQLNNVIYKK